MGHKIHQQNNIFLFSDLQGELCTHEDEERGRNGQAFGGCVLMPQRSLLMSGGHEMKHRRAGNCGSAEAWLHKGLKARPGEK